MKNLGLLLGVFICLQAYAQDDEIPVNMLNAPSSSVFNLMGIESADIVRPKDPTDLYVSVRNSTEGFTTLPKNYAVEFAPYWVFCGRDAKFSTFMSDDEPVKNTFLQTLVISAATRIDDKIDVSNYSQIGAGVKFSLLRGEVSSKFRQQLTKLDEKTAEYNKWIVSYLKQMETTDPVYAELIKAQKGARTVDAIKAANAAVQAYQDGAKQKLIADGKHLTEPIRKHISKMDMKRVGWVSEFNAAAVWEFPDNTAEYSRIRKMGIWFTAGYTPKQATGLDILGMVRYIYSRDQANFFTELDTTLFSEYSNFLDIGGKINYSAPNGKLSVGAEGVARIASVKNPAFWKYGLNINYQLVPNKVLSFTIGQDYTMDDPAIGGDRTLSPSNLVLALNLVLGFGSDRPIN